MTVDIGTLFILLPLGVALVVAGAALQSRGKGDLLPVLLYGAGVVAIMAFFLPALTVGDKKDNPRHEASLDAVITYGAEQDMNEVVLRPGQAPAFYKAGKRAKAQETRRAKMVYAHHDMKVDYFKDVSQDTVERLSPDQDTCRAQEAAGRSVQVCPAAGGGALVRLDRTGLPIEVD